MIPVLFELNKIE